MSAHRYYKQDSFKTTTMTATSIINTTNTSHSHPSSSSSSFLTSYNGGIRSGILSPALSSAASTTSITPITPMTPLTTPRTPAQALLGRIGRSIGGSGSIGGGSHSRPALPSLPQHLHLLRQPPRNQHIKDNQHDPHSNHNQHHNQHHNNVNANAARQQQLLALQLFSNFLTHAETTLHDVTQRERAGQEVLGPGIVRLCHDLAQGVEEVAKEITWDTMRLMEDDFAGPNDVVDGSSSDATTAKTISHQEYLATLSNTQTLLLDMANALRSITQQEAQELGEVAMEVARMFIWSLRMVHRNMSQMTVVNEYHSNEHDNDDIDDVVVVDGMKSVSVSGGGSGGRKHRVTWSNNNNNNDTTATNNNNHHHGLGPLVEILGEEEKKDEQQQQQQQQQQQNNDIHYSISTTPPKQSLPKYTPNLTTIPSSPERTSPTIISSTNAARNINRNGNIGFDDAELLLYNNIINYHNTTTTHHSHHRNNNEGRVRILWPPLLPKVTQATHHLSTTAIQHPLPAIAITLTCAPAAIATAMLIAPPVLLTDYLLQSSYNSLSETHVIETAEKGAANAVQIAKLAVLCGKLVVKQGIVVGESQIRRRGGVGRICADAVGGAVDMAMHPVETVGGAWEGLFWVGGAVRDVVGFVKDSVVASQGGGGGGGGEELGMDIH